MADTGRRAERKVRHGRLSGRSHQTGRQGARIHVRAANRFEYGRGHVVVYNWKHTDTVSADLSPVLSPGDQYEVFDAQCWSCGPVKTGSYDGKAVPLPMTETRFQEPTGDWARDPKWQYPYHCLDGAGTFARRDGPAVPSFMHSSREFGVFVVRTRQAVQAVTRTFDVTAHAGATRLLHRYGYAPDRLDQPVTVTACTKKCSVTFPARRTRPEGLFEQWEVQDATGRVLSRSLVQPSTVQ